MGRAGTVRGSTQEGARRSQGRSPESGMARRPPARRPLADEGFRAGGLSSLGEGDRTAAPVRVEQHRRSTEAARRSSPRRAPCRLVDARPSSERSASGNRVRYGRSNGDGRPRRPGRGLGRSIARSRPRPGSGRKARAGRRPRDRPPRCGTGNTAVTGPNASWEPAGRRTNPSCSCGASPRVRASARPTPGGPSASSWTISRSRSSCRGSVAFKRWPTIPIALQELRIVREVAFDQSTRRSASTSRMPNAISSTDPPTMLSIAASW